VGFFRAFYEKEGVRRKVLVFNKITIKGTKTGYFSGHGRGFIFFSKPCEILMNLRITKEGGVPRMVLGKGKKFSDIMFIGKKRVFRIPFFVSKGLYK
jgi:hypothetical protein